MKITDLTQQEQIIKKPATEIQPTNTRPPIYIRTLNIFTTPFKKRYEKHYQQSKKHLIIDLLLAAAVIFLIIINVRLITEKFPLENISIQFHRSNLDNANLNNQLTAEKPADSQLLITAQVVYFTPEGEQLGLGPWPPKINETSRIRIIMNLKSSRHALDNVNLIITPGPEAQLLKEGIVNIGNALLYDESKNQISWHIDHLAVEDLAVASFTLEINPTIDKVGQKIMLIKNIMASATDVVTKNTLRTIHSSLLTPPVL